MKESITTQHGRWRCYHRTSSWQREDLGSRGTSPSLEEIITKLSLKDEQVDQEDEGEGHSKPEGTEVRKFKGKITRTKTGVLGNYKHVKTYKRLP